MLQFLPGGSWGQGELTQSVRMYVNLTATVTVGRGVTCVACKGRKICIFINIVNVPKIDKQKFW